MVEHNSNLDGKLVDDDRVSLAMLRAEIEPLLAFVRAKPNAIPNFVTWVFWLLLGVRAITLMDTSWDSMAYHLPFAARTWGIFPKSAYMFYDHLEPLYAGQPKLVEFLQGMLWRLTGMVSAANFVGLLCLLLLVLVAGRRLKVPFWMVTLFFLSVPLVLIHSVTSLTDLPPNSMIGLAFVNLLATVDEDRFDKRNLFFVLLPLGVAANMKFQALLIAAPFFVLVVLVFFLKNRQLFHRSEQPSGRSQLAGLLLVCLVSGLILSATYIANLVRYQNPLYPLAVKVGPIVLKGPGYGAFSPQRTQTTTQVRAVLMTRYLASLSEIPLWQTRSGGPLWTVDMGIAWGPKQTGTPYYKTGGFFVANLVLWGVFILASVAAMRSRKSLLLLLLVLGSFVYVSLLPAAYLLRYWLFLPLELALLTLWAYKNDPIRLKSIFKAVIVLQLAIFSFVVYKVGFTVTAGNGVLPTEYTWYHLQDGVQNLDYIRQQYHLATDPSALVCVVGDTRMGFYYKIANPQVPIQSALTDELCQTTTIVHP